MLAVLAFCCRLPQRLGLSYRQRPDGEGCPGHSLLGTWVQDERLPALAHPKAVPSPVLPSLSLEGWLACWGPLSWLFLLGRLVASHC